MGFTTDANGGKSWDGQTGGGNTGLTPIGQTSTLPGSSGFMGNTTAQLPFAPQPLVPQVNMQAQINSLKDAQISAAVSALGKSRDASLSNLTAEQSKIDPMYYGKRNAESTQSQLGAKNFAEYLAQKGETNAGVANQSYIADNVALQGGLGALNTQQLADQTDNARRVTGINNAYESDIVGAKSGAEATALQNLISQQNLDRTFNQAASQWQQGFNADQGQRTIQNGQWDQNFNADQTQRGVTNGQWNQNFNADQTQRGVQNNQWTQGFNADQTQRGVTNNQWDQNFNADQNYRMSQLAASQAKVSNKVPAGTKGADGGKYSDSATASMKEKIEAALANGSSIDELLSGLNGDVEDGTSKLKNYDTDYLRSFIESKRPAPTTTPSSSLNFLQKWR